MPVVGPLIGLGFAFFVIFLVFLVVFGGNSTAALIASIAVTCVIMFFAVLSLRASSRKMRTGTGTWVKRYDDMRRANTDANEMAKYGWMVAGQSSAGVRGKVVITWQRLTQSSVVRQTGTPSTTTSYVPPAPIVPPPTSNLSGELAKVAQLHSDGILSDGEFTSAKARLLGGGPN
jgi:hypothetical protein